MSIVNEGLIKIVDFMILFVFVCDFVWVMGMRWGYEG